MVFQITYEDKNQIFKVLKIRKIRLAQDEKILLRRKIMVVGPRLNQYLFSDEEYLYFKHLLFNNEWLRRTGFTPNIRLERSILSKLDIKDKGYFSS